MAEFVLTHQQWLMLAQIALTFVLLGWWESARPLVARAFDEAQARRQTTNILLLVANSLFLYVVGLAALWWLAALPVYLLVDFSKFSAILSVPIGIILLDLGSYFRHRLMHWRWFWSVHRVHHSDDQMNWTTEFRFHPLEALVGLCIKSCVVLVFGIPPVAVALYALIALGVGCCQHANVWLPARLDKGLSLWLVTPGLHQVHHQPDTSMQGANFGVLFPWWDRLLGTFREANSGKRFGLLDSGELDLHSIRQLLLLPLKRAQTTGER